MPANGAVGGYAGEECSGHGWLLGLSAKGANAQGVGLEYANGKWGDGHKCAKGTRRVLGMSAQGAERADYGCQRVLGKSVQGALDRAHMNIGSNTRESTQKTGRMANHINISTQSEALDN
eukprot:1155105-Pelagomonas_calceolata.AAC.5